MKEWRFMTFVQIKANNIMDQGNILSMWTGTKRVSLTPEHQIADKPTHAPT